MSKIGFTVFWSVADSVCLAPSALDGYSFARRLPQNSYKTALIKAVKRAKKTITFGEIVDLSETSSADVPRTLRAIHQRYLDSKDECAIAIVVPRVNAEGVRYEQAMQITVNKLNGQLVFVDPEGGEPSPELVAAVKDGFKVGSETIDAVQFRNLVHKEITHACSGVSLRAFSGGIYYVPVENEAKLDELIALFDRVGGEVKFARLPIYGDDPYSVRIADESAVEAFCLEMERFTSELQRQSQSGPTRRVFEERAEKIDEIKRKVELYRGRLKEHADKFTRKLDNLCSIIDSHLIEGEGKTLGGFDLLAELASISA